MSTNHSSGSTDKFPKFAPKINHKKMSNPIIHIGLHKTGTTYLQSSLFPNLKNYNVYRGYESHRQLLKLGREKKIIISDEGISGDLWGMNYLNDFKENIYFLKKTYNNPKIIFGIRNHSSFILSVYKQYLHEKGTNDLDFLYNINNTGIIKSEELLLLPKITLLRESFEKVFIYSQESLISNENDFISALTNFLDTDINSNYQSQKDSNVGVNTILQV